MGSTVRARTKLATSNPTTATENAKATMAVRRAVLYPTNDVTDTEELMLPCEFMVRLPPAQRQAFALAHVPPDTPQNSARRAHKRQHQSQIVPAAVVWRGQLAANR